MLEGSAWAFVAARQKVRPFSAYVEDGTIRRTRGNVPRQRTFQRVFALG